MQQSMFSNVAVENSAGADFHRHKDIENAERSGHGHEEVARNDNLRVVANEGRPALIASWRARMFLTEILPDRSRRNLDSEFKQQFVGDALFAPRRILAGQRSDDLSEVSRQRGTTAFSRLPSPEVLERGAVPFQEAGWFDDDKGIAPLEESSEEYHLQTNSACGPPRFGLPLLEQRELSPKEEVLGNERSTR